ncbi:hypothetical protein GcM3_053042 [Golovinomyces cichoracearum]|uniref:Uncharacterized protein n=1 Tax=Golovinomyces cichoracearum TaxID=62708 RepID=A0A420IYP8_9PEZI|nr:hypothetical protein GcM3_053042 [Golovinomyces cichoracearum]
MHTNIIASSILKRKGVYLDSRINKLMRDNKCFAHLFEHGGHFLLTRGKLTRTAMHLTSSGTPDWHRHLAHPGSYALKHIKSSCDGVNEVLNNIKNSADCEICALSKSHQQISRQPRSIEPKPYHTVHFDLTELSTGFNHDRWLAHFTCKYTQMSHGFTLSSRSKIPSVFNSFIAYVRVQFQAQV